MAQSIKIKIAGREYPFQVTSEDQEHYMRLAADDVNETLATYSQKFPDKELADKLVFVALIETMARLRFQKKAALAEQEANSLGSELKAYLESVSKK
ncbi:MAG: cell division protein ZapA [Bacteroidales bacterium]|nr:cell division protein ZapA [Bacteroidales bacterium]